jgi:peptide/nickel transport system substrate-binding protein
MSAQPNPANATDLVARLKAGELTRRQFLTRALGAGLTAPVVAAALAEVTVAAPGPRGAVRPSYQADETTLVIADNLKDNWITLDPGWIYEINSQAAENVVYECLYHLPDSTKPTEFAPLLADGDPVVAEDGVTVTIKLRPGITFHNTGTEAKAADWVFSWTRTRNIKWQGAWLATDFWDTVTAVDDYTLQIVLKSPNAALVAILSSAPLGVIDSATVIANGGTDAEEADQTDTFKDWHDANTSVGTGPYVMTQFDIDGEVILEANPSYWGDAPAIQRIIWRNIVDPNAQLQSVQAGEADIAYAIDPDNVNQITGDASLQLISGPTLAHDYLALHTQAEPGGPLANKAVRQAIGYAIDYEGIIGELMGGAGNHPATIVPLGLLSAEEALPFAYARDLTKAQELFDSAAVGPAEVTLTYNAGGSGSAGIDNETLMAKLQADIQGINGLTVKLSPLDGATRLQQYREGKLQFTFSGWAPDYPDVHTYADPFGASTGSAAKRVGYVNPAIDELLAQGIAELDPAARAALYLEIQKILIEDAPFLVLYQTVDQKPATAKVQGVATHSVYQLQLRYATKTA